MINPMQIMKLKQMWDQFNQTHPRITPFIKAVAATGIPVGTVIEATVSLPDGRSYTTNMKVTETDLELVDALKSMKQ